MNFDTYLKPINKEKLEAGEFVEVRFQLLLARSDRFKFFSNFWRFWNQMKAHIFLISLVNFTVENVPFGIKLTQ